MTENPSNETINENNEDGVGSAAPRHSRLSRALNGFFRHIDRGSTLKGEVMSGLTVFFLAVCVIFMNVQIVVNALGAGTIVESSPEGPGNIANGTVIATMYAGAMIVAFAGSMLVGLVARLPFVQISTMGLSSTMVSLLGTTNGLTYHNILFVSFVAAVVYAVVVSVPVLRRYTFEALPRPVRKALPAATGLTVMLAAAQQSGFVVAGPLTGGTTLLVATGGTDGVSTIAFVAVVVAVVAYVLLRALRVKHHVFWSVLGGTLTFAVVMLIAGGTNTSSPDSFVNFGRLWVMVGSQASEITPFGDSWFSYMADGIGGAFADVGRVFTEGTSFAEGVNAPAFIIGGTLCYLFTGMYDAEATLRAVSDDVNAHSDARSLVLSEDEKGGRLARICNAGINVISPLFGMCGTTLSKTSVAGTRDGGRSGIVSIVAALGFLVSLFVWVAPVLFATRTYVAGSMNDFNYNAYGNGGFIATFTSLGFGVADAVMVCVGASMLRGLRDVDMRDIDESIPVIATLAVTLLTSCVAYGAAAGALAYLAVKLCAFRVPGEGTVTALRRIPDSLRSVTVPNAVLCVLFVLMFVIIFALA